MTRRVGAERRRITAVRQGRLADISALIEESLSVSGILLGKTMGRCERARGALRARVGGARRPRGPLADGRPLADGLGPDRFRRDAGAHLPLRRPQHRQRRRRRSRSARWSPSRRCRRGSSSRSSRCSPSASTCRARWRCSSASSSTSSCRSRSRSATARSRLDRADVRGEVDFERRRLPLRGRRRLDPARHRPRDPARDDARASSARRARERRRSPTCSPGSTTSRRAA